jgi:small-conductance mechanosensitive channel
VRSILWAICLIGCLGVSAAATTPPNAPAPATATVALPLPPEQVVTHVSRTITWYRRIVALQQLPVDSDDVVPRDRLYQAALTSLQLAFDFGQAAGAMAGKAQTAVAAQAVSKEHGASSSGPGGKPASDATRSATPATAADAGADAGTGTRAGASAGSGNDSQDSDSQESAVDKAAARMADRISNLQAQLTSLDEQIAHAAAKDKDTLVARRGEVSAALDLAKEIQGTVGQIQRFEEASDAHANGASGGLAAQIEDLRRSVPEIRVARAGSRFGSFGASDAQAPGAGSGAASGANSGASGAGASGGGGSGASGAGSSNSGAAAPRSAAPASPAAPPANTETFRPESAGVIALLGKWFSLEGARRDLADGTKQTEGLTKDLGKIREAVTQEARSLARENLDATSTDPAQLAQSKLKFQQAATRFKQLSTLIVPLGEQGISVENAHTILEEWRDSLAARTATVARYLALRLGFLLGSVAVVLVISEVWRRATFRYLQDARRRQQFLALRRVAVGLALTLVLVFGLVSEVGSLATYAGLITAGLAVALQNVILAVVAYFFLIGRYGVRVGDRITLAGVTGRVVEIGLVRIYLMELTGPQLRSTGRMVVLSNAVLFQPTALFKQMPGGDFYWHTITLTLAPTTDVADAEKRLSEAAESVYAKYRPAIEQQHAALQRFIDFQTAMPQPEVYARLNAKGLECTVRYPVEPAQAAATDQKMLLALREAQSKAPELQLVDGPLLDTGES